MVHGTFIREAGRCTDLGKECFGSKNCINNVRAVNVTYPGFAEFCPHLADGPICCTESQFNNLVGRLQPVNTFFARCPACIHNFQMFWCEYTCSPNQSLFVDVADTIPYDGGRYINRTNDHRVLSSSAYQDVVIHHGASSCSFPASDASCHQSVSIRFSL